MTGPENPDMDTTAPAEPTPAAMQSAEIGKLADALAKAQKAMGPLEKNKTATIQGKAKGSGNTFKYSYAYADLPAVIDNLRGALADNGLSYVQRTRIDGNRFMLETRLLHTSGQWISSDWPLAVPDREDPKQTASLLTYGRRYSLTSLCGISAEETDDDADHGRKVERVKGKLGKSALTTKIRAFVADMRECVVQADSDQLEALIGSHGEILDQCKTDLYREWWASDPGTDVKGLEDQIAEARRRIKNAALEPPQEPAGRPAPALSFVLPDGKIKDYASTKAGAMAFLNDLEVASNLDRNAWETNKGTVARLIDSATDVDVKKRAVALENAMETTELAG